MCRVSLVLADAAGFIRVNYFCVLLVGEIFLRVGMPPPDFSANSQIFSCLPFSLCFSNGRGSRHPPALQLAGERSRVGKEKSLNPQLVAADAGVPDLSEDS